MTEIVQTLSDAGLTGVEIDAYLAILSNGPISAGKVAKLTRNYRPNVYQAIERLKGKGFISETPGKKARLYEVLSPDHILNDFSRKHKSLQKVTALLKKMQATSMTTTSMRIIEGVNGWRHLLNEYLEIGTERVVYGVPKDAVELLSDFFMKYHKKRAKRKIKLRHLFNYDAKERIKITNKLPYTQSRYLPKELDQPVSTSVCGSTVAIAAYEGKEVVTVVIENELIANAYRKYFEFLWNMAQG